MVLGGRDDQRKDPEVCNVARSGSSAALRPGHPESFCSNGMTIAVEVFLAENVRFNYD